MANCLFNYGLTYQQTFEILNAADIDPATNDLEGQSINGSAVKKVTGSDILKLNWNSSRATDQRKTDQIMFSIKKSLVDGKDYFDLKDYNDNMYNNGKGFNAKNVTINVGDKDIPINKINVTVDWDTEVKSTGNIPKQNTHLKTYTHEYRDPSGRFGAQRILITFDENYYKDYTKFYY